MRIAPNISNLIINNPTTADMMGFYLTICLCILLIAYIARACTNKETSLPRIPRSIWGIIAICYIATMGMLLNHSIITASKVQYALITQSYTFPMADAISMLPAPQSHDSININTENTTTIDLRTAISEQVDDNTQTIRFTIVPKNHSHNQSYILRVSTNNTQNHSDYTLSYKQFTNLIDRINQTNTRIHPASHHHVDIITPVDEQPPTE